MDILKQLSARPHTNYINVVNNTMNSDISEIFDYTQDPMNLTTS